MDARTTCIAANLAAVRARIDAAAGGREVRLVCVTKYASVEQATALLAAGADELGESRLPEGWQRIEQLRSGGHTFTTHLIGALQSRKAALAARFDWFQALERLDVAVKLNAARPADAPPLEVLAQVNIGAEAQKHGVAPEQLEPFIEALLPLTRLRLRGLMCIPPGPTAYASAAEYERGTRGLFRQMRAWSDRIAASFPQLRLDTLSMGMSQDYGWAVEEGATMVRVGSALLEGVEG